MLKCYEEIVKIREAIQSKHYPNVQAVARESLRGDVVVHSKYVVHHAISCVQPELLYFQDAILNILLTFSKHPGYSVHLS